MEDSSKMEQKNVKIDSNASDSVNSDQKNVENTVENDVLDGELAEKFFLKREGSARMLYPKGNQVFYNPAQEVNRDLSIMCIKLFEEQLLKERTEAQSSAKKKRKDDGIEIRGPEAGLSILEALSATGLRSIRYAKELKGVKKIIANDIDANAVEAIRRNLQFNQVDPNFVIPNHADATTFMYLNREPSKQFEVVDLDPYGSASIFLDGAVQSVAEGGLLCVTCTDTAVLCGNHSETCFTKYGSVSLHSRFAHEMAVRIVLQSIERHAAKHKRYIVPLVSMHIDFYIRIFVRVYTSANECKKSATKLSNVYQCIGCDSFHSIPLMKMIETKNGGAKFSPSVIKSPSVCPDCDSNYKIGGPIWSAPMHDREWVTKLLNHIETNEGMYGQSKKVHGLLSAVLEELPNNPLYYTLDGLKNTLHLSSLSMDEFKSAILHAGYEVSGAHACPEGVKTSASNEAVWDILRSWEKKHPLSEKRRQQTQSAAVKIITKESKLVKEANFEKHPSLLIKPKVTRFVHNPPFWGPGTRAGRGKGKEDGSDNRPGPEKKGKQQKKENEQKEETMSVDSSPDQEPNSKKAKK